MQLECQPFHDERRLVAQLAPQQQRKILEQALNWKKIVSLRWEL
jgi:hypothetical protein